MTLPRVYPILDAASLNTCGISAVAAARALLNAGATIIQGRWKTHLDRKTVDDALEIAELCRTFSCNFIVNDRADIAMLCHAGLHVGQDDLPPHAARQLLGAGPIIGYSSHNDFQLQQAAREPVNYIALGPIFSTSSKANPDPVLGTAELRRLRPLSPLPLVAIGGITLDNAHEVWDAGADSVAIIGDLLREATDVTSIERRFTQWKESAAA